MGCCRKRLRTLSSGEQNMKEQILDMDKIMGRVKDQTLDRLLQRCQITKMDNDKAW